jgi:hypothetical protein
MEFEEIKKIWDAQNNELLYAVNEKALHNHILSKKRQAYHITNVSELLWIITNSSAGCFIIGMNYFKQSWNIFICLLAIWMLGSALYLLISRIRRIKGSSRFDRSMKGDLKHAISMATYQVRFSQLGRWSILPVVMLTLLGVWDSGKSVWIVVGIIIFFILTYFAAGWEHNIYKARKRELEILQNKLDSEDSADRTS